MRVIDANGLVLGRMSASVAKMALMGEDVAIVNAENAIISGSKKDIMRKYKPQSNVSKPFHGPFTQRMPDRFVRRTIRGMLPYKQEKGRQAYKRVMCYIGIPAELEDHNIETIESASSDKLKTAKFMRIKDIAKLLGAKI